MAVCNLFLLTMINGVESLRESKSGFSMETAWKIMFRNRLVLDIGNVAKQILMKAAQFCGVH